VVQFNSESLDASEASGIADPMSLPEQSNGESSLPSAHEPEVRPKLWSEDSRGTEELFAATLDGDYDDDAPWDAVHVLRLRGTSEVFDIAKIHCESENPKARARGLDVLGQLGGGKPDAERPYKGDCISTAIHKLEDPDPLVVHSAAWALAHLSDDRAALALVGKKRHPDPSIRQAVAVGLGACEEPAATETLIELMNDESDVVRDWATFELGSIGKQDSPEIRAALRERVNDSFEDARDEAIWGLAQRKDAVGLSLVLDRLQAKSWKSWDEDAAMAALGLREAPSIEKLCEGLRELIAQEK
jgi:HEAT repeat protein